MRRQIKEFIGVCAKTLPIQGPVYEFGSRQMDGQVGYADLRPLFIEHEYIGADYIAGPGVDIVLDLRNIDLPNNSVQTALCLEVLEHVDDPALAVQELHRIMANDGLLMVSVPMNIRIHGSPHDFWRFTPQGLDVLLQRFPHRFIGHVGRHDYPDNIVAVVSKSPLALARFKPAITAWQKRWCPFRERLSQATPPWSKLLLPRFLIGDELELWLRRRTDANYPALRNFLRLLAPPLLSRLLGRGNKEKGNGSS
jgi:SAM-dependent methyltransferase